MQDEVNEKVVSLCISGGKISARILKNVLMKYLLEVETERKTAGREICRKGRSGYKYFLPWKNQHGTA